MKADALVNLSNVASGCKMIPSRHLRNCKTCVGHGQCNRRRCLGGMGPSRQRESSGVMRQFGIGNVILSSSTIRTEYSLIAHKVGLMILYFKN